MSSDLGYYIGSTITAALGTHAFIELNRDKWWMVLLMLIYVLVCTVMGGLVGAIIHESIKKKYAKWTGIGKKNSQKYRSEG